MLYEGTVERVYYQNDNWYAFSFRDNATDTLFSVSGKTGCPIFEKHEIKIDGSEFIDPKYGKKIIPKTIVPKDEMEMISDFISMNLPYVTKKIAAEIVKDFGKDAIDKLKKKPELLLKHKGIKEKKLSAIKLYLENMDSNIYLRLDIFNFFSGRITENQLTKISECLRIEHLTFEDIKKNPYILIRKIDGFGFKTIDKLGISAGISLFSKERIYAALVYCLRELSYTEGHVYADREMLFHSIRQLLCPIMSTISYPMQKNIEKILADVINYEDYLDSFSEPMQRYLKFYFSDVLKLETIVSEIINDVSHYSDIVVDGDKLYWSELYNSEKGVARFVARKAMERPIRFSRDLNKEIVKYEKKTGIFLADEQKDAIRKAFSSTLSVISGGPGRGKSTIIDAIINIWEDKDHITLLAPTGKAAKRMTEITGLKASTIHKFIPSHKYGTTLLVVDECSMVGIQLFYRLIKELNLIKRPFHMVLIGDVDQLASIEPGNLLRDIIKSKAVPVTMLVKGFRNAGSIAKNAAMINAGEGYGKLILDEDTEFIEADNDTILEKTIEAYQNALKTFDKKDVLLLSPMKKNGFACTENINEVLSKMTTGSETYPVPNCKFRVGDRVLQITNSYNRVYAVKGEKEEEEDIEDVFDWSFNSNPYTHMPKEAFLPGYTTEKGIFNGDLGTITKIDSNYLSVKFDDDRYSDYKIPNEVSQELLLSYAMTVHKAQGSEAKCVIVIVSKQHSFFLKRNLLYTAMTRAKKKLILIGDKRAIGIAAKREDDKKRNSYLVERIKEELESIL